MEMAKRKQKFVKICNIFARKKMGKESKKRMEKGKNENKKKKKKGIINFTKVHVHR